MSILEVKNLSVEFQVEGAWLPAVSDLSFDLEKGQILALVGESGCGKSVTCLSLARLLPEPPARYTSGTITVNGQSVLDATKKQLREIRRHDISYIFQEPSVSLNPVFRVGDQIAEALVVAGTCEDSGITARVVELLRQVGIPEPEKRMRAYPHELSGGMQQRVMIAMALAKEPDILVADEPTTALDVTIQAQILDLLRGLRESSNMSIILVTHNLGIVSDFAEKMVVMYAGHAVEAADTAEILESPLHPYTRALLSAVPKLGRQDEKLATIPGIVPSPADFPKGCRFFGRCTVADTSNPDTDPELLKLCSTAVPDWREISKGHYSRCHCSK